MTHDPLAAIRVLIVADDPLARAGLATVLEERPELSIVGQVAADAALAVSLDVYRADVVLWDLGWDPDGVPVDLWDGDLPLLALLPHAELAAEAWGAGAGGLLLRDGDEEQLLAALQAVAQQLVVVDPALAQALRPALPGDETAPAETLTSREMEVLHLLAEGLSNRAIAQELDISEHTVKFHVTAIMGKLNAQSRTEAVVRAMRLGLIAL
jgi:DNA-binding NarL/FixJ family response regulator